MSDIKFMPGEGATARDLERGYLNLDLPLKPEYDATSYRQRWTQSKSDADIWDSDSFKFRQEESESKGFLTRPVLPTER